MNAFEDDLIFEVETNDDDTEIALVVRSLTGKKITQHDFIVALEAYLHDVATAEIYRTENKSPTH